VSKPAPPILWTPSREVVDRSNVGRYMSWLTTQRGRRFAGYDELWRWSVEDLDGFWSSIWDYFDVASSRPPTKVLGKREMPSAQWFPGTEVNYAEHVLRGGHDGEVAILEAGELRELNTLTWGALRDLTARVATGLRALGVTRGDRVAAFMPNIAEAVAAFLACSSIGAVWSSCSPDFGVRSVISRFAQIEPKVLIAVDGYRYGGRDFDRRSVVRQLHASMPSLQHTVMLSYLDPTGRLEGTLTWDELVGQAGELQFERVPFDHPLWILYSSGTTGLPKGIVHAHGGVLLEHIKHMHLHVDAQPGDRIMWFTTTGWMMWNFLIGCLLTDAAIVLYDGDPGHPSLDVLWNLADKAGVTCFGTSASYISSCMKAHVVPRHGRALATLRAVGSTGSPLSADGFKWIYDQLGTETWLFSTSGGSDVCTAFVTGCVLVPVYEGELQCRALGANVEAWNEAGQAVVEDVGELVITEPLPSMPIGLWNDPEDERYRASYFSMFPGVWRHGDWIEITERGSAVIHGRSDSTINRGGIRMGTAEIYSAVLTIDEVSDALVVDVDGWMPLFVVLAPGAALDDELTRRISRRVREDCSPRHVPSEVIALAEIPRTLSGKILEVPIKRILSGTPPEEALSRDSVANPQSLQPFVALSRERR
jgi:acetoacetyl-CoA synthetase